MQKRKPTWWLRIRWLIDMIWQPMKTFYFYDLTSSFGSSWPSDSNKGSSTNRIKPVCDDDLETFSLSMKGEIGKPSSFSMSLWNHNNITWFLKIQIHLNVVLNAIGDINQIYFTLLKIHVEMVENDTLKAKCPILAISRKYHKCCTKCCIDLNSASICSSYYIVTP